ncbi:MAG: hypothetical protein JO199_01360 [Candidatus Eremiobacteraeota bacterium]|nr:hypothetical protein [Candidatus Eremiobacteraeota bacterium]
MKTFARTAIASLALAAILGPASLTIPASAQVYVQVPVYTTWQPAWDADDYVDQARHVMVGTVVDFSPYRLTVQNRNGVVQTVDLKNGTRIYPVGATPSPGERAAMVGYWSNGTFIVNRVVLRG